MKKCPKVSNSKIDSKISMFLDLEIINKNSYKHNIKSASKLQAFEKKPNSQVFLKFNQ